MCINIIHPYTYISFYLITWIDFGNTKFQAEKQLNVQTTNSLWRLLLKGEKKALNGVDKYVLFT